MSIIEAGSLVLSAVLAGVTVLLLVATAVEHAGRSRRAVRTARRRAELTPLVHALLAEDAPAAEVYAADPLLDELVLELLPQLRGADRAALQTVLVERGVVDQAAVQLGARAAWRRGRAAELLGNVASSRHVPELVALLADPVADVRSAAARALGRIGDVAAAPPLLAALGARPPVRPGVVGMALLDHALDARPPVPPGIVGMALLDLGTPALPALRAAVDGPLPEARPVAAQLLGLHGDPGATGVLAAVVADERRPPVERQAAASALGRIGSPQATPALVAALTSTGPLAVRVAAAEALGRIGDPTCLNVLTVSMRTAPVPVRATCADALAALGDVGRARLVAHAFLTGPTGAAARAALDASRALVPRRPAPGLVAA